MIHDRPRYYGSPPDPIPNICAMRDCGNLIMPGDGVDTGETIICEECADSHCNRCFNHKVKVPGSICEECAAEEAEYLLEQQNGI